MITILKRSTALAACAALSLAAAQAVAETDMAEPDGQWGDVDATESTDGFAEEPGSAAEPGEMGDQLEAEPGAAAESDQQFGNDQMADNIVARVGDKEIMQSDVRGVIEALPPEIQEQPEETLVPLAVEQLILRELLLDKAEQEGLDNDPDVEALMAGTGSEGDEARENAMVQIWLDRELEDAVTDEAVEDTYEAVQAQYGDDVPPMAEIRPQLEEEVRRQAFLDLSTELQQDADVTLYGPDGEPAE